MVRINCCHACRSGHEVLLEVVGLLVRRSWGCCLDAGAVEVVGCLLH